MTKQDFPYTFNEKRYHTFNYYLKTRYQCKVSKVILDAGFTCPNRDGSKGVGGCIFCSEAGSGDSNLSFNDDLLSQYKNNKAVMDRKWPNGMYIPYFQSFSNTYGPLKRIKEMTEPLCHQSDVTIITMCQTRLVCHQCINDLPSLKA